MNTTRHIQQLVERARTEYGLAFLDGTTDLGSDMNITLLVSDATTNWVLRAYHPHTTRERVESIQRVRDAVRAAGHPIPEIVPTRTGDRVFVAGDRTTELEQYVPGEDMNPGPRLLHGMQRLGRIHDVLRTIDDEHPAEIAPYANYAHPDLILEITRRSGQRMRDRSLLQHPELTYAAEELAERIAEPDRAFAADMPRQFVHGDYWDNNVLFGGDEIVAVIDFDFVGLRTRIDDIGLILCYANTGWNIDDPIDDRLRESRQIVNAYDSGLSQPLSEAERLALPYVMVRNVLPPFSNLVHIADDARRHGYEAGMGRDLDWALQITATIDQWQDALHR